MQIHNKKTTEKNNKTKSIALYFSFTDNKIISLVQISKEYKGNILYNI